MPKKSRKRPDSRYKRLIETIFLDGFEEGASEFEFEREDLSRAAKRLKIMLPKNLGDVVYSNRYRASMPGRILRTQPEGMEWVIEGKGRSRYAFKLVRINRIVPNQNLVAVKIPDATPELISAYALSDEQALLAKVRYNRLVDIFLGLTTYSLQNHLRTTVDGIGQIEIDELYVGIDKFGCQFILPVQAKGGADQLAAIQTKQDLACCKEKFTNLVCRPISAQFMADNLIALFELVLDGDDLKVVEEKHYRLVPSDQITDADLEMYKNRS